MHRQHSLQPFSRHYSHSTNPFLDFLELDDSVSAGASTSTSAANSASVPADGDHPPAEAGISVRSSNPAHLRAVLAAYKAVQRAGTLHTLTFVTVNEYLWLLRAVSKELSVLRRKAMYYLAAAVSDFFLPTEKMVRLPLSSLSSRA